MLDDPVLPAPGKRLRRSPSALRAEALSSARRLIVERPGQPLTMRAVADAIGVTYPNIAHHFGSLNGLYAAIGDELVGELFEALKLTSDGLHSAPHDAASLVHLVFDIFDKNGLGTLLEWMLRANDSPAVDTLKTAVSGRIAAFHGEMTDDESTRFRQLFMVLGLVAYAEVSAGRFFGDILGMDDEARRALMASTIRAITARTVDNGVNSAIVGTTNSAGADHDLARRSDDHAA